MSNAIPRMSADERTEWIALATHAELERAIDGCAEQRDRARETLSKIRGIIVAHSKGIGSHETAIAAIASILHVGRPRGPRGPR